MSIDAALSGIKNVLGAGGFLDAPADMQPYLASWRNGWTGKSPLIALPSTVQQVSEIVAICSQNRIPVVPQGGNTGLVGGGIPSSHGDEIVLNLSRLNKILEFDKIGSTVSVQAGVVLQVLQSAAADAGFLFPLSMASEGSAQIGGAISTNAGGTAVLRYGNMRDLVMGIEAVLPDGRIFNGLKKLPKDNTGYNLAQYFIGSEGTLGIVTAATLKLFPPLRQKVTSVLAISDAATALELLGDFRKECGEYLTAFEIMSKQALELVIKHIPTTRYPVKDTSPYYLLVELGASSDTAPLRAMFEGLTSRAMEKGKILDAALAETTQQAKQFWGLRENISKSLRQEGGGLHFDISLPLDQIAEFLASMEPKIKFVALDIRLVPFGHIGDGNLHYNMCLPKSNDSAALKTKIRELVYGVVKSMQGSISAEHGIGIERKAELLSYKSVVALDMMKSVKRAIDPQNLMNPGKIFD